MSFETNLLSGIQHKAVQAATDLITGKKQNNKNANKQNTGAIQRFITEIQANNGLFRPTFFEVHFNGLTSTKEADSFSLLCHTAMVPGYRLDTHQNTYYSLPYEVPTGIVFDPFFCTFYIDNRFKLPFYLYQNLKEKRMNLDNYSPKYRDEASTMEVTINAFTSDINAYAALGTNPNLPQELAGTAAQVTSDGLPLIAQYKLKNAFIKAVQQTPLDWSAHNSLSSMTVEISYEWFEVNIPGVNVTVPPVDPKAKAPVNFDTILQKYPALGVAYDAAKRTVLQNQSIMSNPLINQATQFIP